ncbi:LysR family transcriptional regulator [Paraglaciecola aestuariivivens]
MDIRFLVTFMEVAKTRHFGKAAENLYLTQSAVSARIKQLEEYFNSALFVRNRNSLQLTPAGEKLLPFAQTLADTLEQARQTMNEQSIEFLTLACSPNAWDTYLQAQLASLNHQLDGVSLRAEITSNEQLSRMVHEHSIDLAITTVPFKSDDVETLELSQSPLGLYCSADLSTSNPLEFALAIDWGRKTNDYLDKCYPELKKASLRTGSIQVALNYLSQRASAIVLPKVIAQPLVQSNQLKFLEQIDGASVSSYLIYLKESKNAKLADFIKIFKQNIKQQGH